MKDISKELASSEVAQALKRVRRSRFTSANVYRMVTWFTHVVLPWGIAMSAGRLPALLLGVAGLLVLALQRGFMRFRVGKAQQAFAGTYLRERLKSAEVLYCLLVIDGSELRARVERLLADRRGLKVKLPAYAPSPQMREQRELPLNVRRDVFLRDRVADQIDFHTRRSREDAAASRQGAIVDRWLFAAVLVLQAALIASGLVVLPAFVATLLPWAGGLAVYVAGSYYGAISLASDRGMLPPLEAEVAETLERIRAGWGRWTPGKRSTTR